MANRSGGGGGGIWVINDWPAARAVPTRALLNSNPRIQHNIIAANRGGRGAGIEVRRNEFPSKGNVLVANNLIAGNDGPGLYTYRWDLVVTNNTIVGNRHGEAGGVLADVGATVEIANTIVDQVGNGHAIVAGRTRS